MERKRDQVESATAATKLFVSYKSQDQDFVDTLTSGLKRLGYDIWRDRDSIAPATEWRREIKDGIDNCAAMVLVLSPLSVQSSEVGDEVDQASAHGKLIIPVKIGDVDPKQAPSVVEARHWISWTAADDPDEALAEIDRAMKIDPEWTKAHASLNGRALAWRDRGDDKHLLISGATLDEAELAVAKNRGPDQPQVTALMREFVAESRREATRRQRRTILITVAVAAVSLVLAGLAVVFALRAIASEEEANDQRDIAEEQREEAEDQREEADRQRAVAVEEREEAERQRDIALSGALAARSENRFEQVPDLAALLALEAYRTSPTVDALGALLNAVDSSTTFLQRVDAHDAPVRVIARHDESGLAATGDLDGEVEVWTVGFDGVDPLFSFDVGTSVTAMAFDDSGSRLTVVRSIGPPQLWNVAGDEPVKATEGAKDLYTSISHDGQLAAGITRLGDNAWLTVGDPFSGEVVADFDLGFGIRQLGAEATDPVFSRDGRLVAFADGSDIYVGLVDEQVLLPFDIYEIEGVDSEALLAVESLAFVGDGRLAVGVLEGHIYLVDPFGGQAEALLPLTSSAPRALASIAASEDGETFELLASAHNNGEVKIWLLGDTGASEFSTLRGHTEEGLAVSLASDGVVISADWLGDLIVSYAFESWQIGFQLTDESLDAVHRADVDDVEFLDATTIVSRDTLDKAQLWSTETLLPVGGKGGRISALGAAGGRLAIGRPNGTVAVGTPPDGPVDLEPVHSAGVTVVELSDDGSTVASASSGEVWLWDADGGRVAEVALPADFDVAAMAFSGDDRLWLAGKVAGDGPVVAQVLEVDASTGQVLQTGRHNEQDGHVAVSVAVSPDGSTVATGGTDRKVFLFDATDLTVQPRELAQHVEEVSGLDFFDDEVLVAGDRDGGILLWHVPTGRVVGELTGPDDGVTSVAVDRDVEQLVVGSEDDYVWVWDLRLESWIEGACRIAGRNLTDGEWSAFRPEESPVAHCPDVEDTELEAAVYPTAEE